MLLKTENSYTECSLKTFWTLFSVGIDKDSGVYDSVNDQTSLHSEHINPPHALNSPAKNHSQLLNIWNTGCFCLDLLSTQISWALLHSTPSKCHRTLYYSFLIRSSLISHVLISWLINICFFCVYFCVLLLLFLNFLKHLHITTVPTDMPSN